MMSQKTKACEKLEKLYKEILNIFRLVKLLNIIGKLRMIPTVSITLNKAKISLNYTSFLLKGFNLIVILDNQSMLKIL
jgi:hypothetical protein